VAVTAIPPRLACGMLARALGSVARQSRPPAAAAVAVDVDRAGAPATRDRALAMVDTEYVAFLDDDDELGEDHLALLAAEAARTGADLVYPWYTVDGGVDPHAAFEGVPWDDARPHQVPVTFLARTRAIRAAGGFSHAWDPSQGEDPGTDALGNRAGEDYRLILRLVALGAAIVHLPVRTWTWHHHSRNTMGLPSRW
jgi:glycosyltransferase involved in cell wall biosynthesis